MGKFQPSPINLCNFGKYKGKTFEEIFDLEPNYLAWMLQTTDPADLKNNGKYAKQNQERIKYIKAILGRDEGDDFVPETKPNLPKSDVPVNATVSIKVLENILKILVKVDEKIDKILLAKQSNDTVIQTDEDLVV